jgi:endonuclease/exonuclease/phosphatase family metal-dependent hydrolase
MTTTLHRFSTSLIRLIGRLSIAAAQVLAFILTVWLLLRLYPGDRWLLVRLGSYFAPWLLMTLFPALIIALLGKRRWLTGFILLLTLVIGMNYIFLLTPKLSRAQAQNHSHLLRVMTFNVHYANRDATAIANLIATENPDIIALQEMTPGLAVLLYPKLAAEYPHHLTGEGTGFEKVLVSRYPLTALPKPPEAWGGLLGQVQTPNGPVVVWNLHPPPAVKQNGWQAQQQTLAAIAQEIKGEIRPLIVLGDFNTTDQAENYRLIANHLTDVHWAVGRGLGFTFPEPDVISRAGYGQLLKRVSPVVRIDHIFVNKHFDPQETHVVSHGFGSDHRPVVATLRLAQ